eukprot:m.11153 g.11153  ORF g.11153 m.11153 type:complete len:245 (-) comp5676_c0_seq1:87-821(-)
MANEVVADVFCTLLEVSIHTILYMRQVYPVHIFAKSRVYNITTLTSRHPELTDYIANVVASIREWIIKGKVKAVVVVLFNECHQPVERFVFDLDISLLPRGDSSEGEMEAQLRALLLKLNMCDALLTDKAGPLTFGVHVMAHKDGGETAAEAAEEAELEAFPWVVADDDQVSMNTLSDSLSTNATVQSQPSLDLRHAQAASDVGSASVQQAATKVLCHPLKTISTSLFTLNLYVEEQPAHVARA